MVERGEKRLRLGIQVPVLPCVLVNNHVAVLFKMPFLKESPYNISIT